METVYLSAAAASAHDSNENTTGEPPITVLSTVEDEDSRTTNVDEPAEVKVDVEQTAASPVRLLSPHAAAAANKPLPTANGPTWPVVTRPRLSRTLDLSTSRCVETTSTAPDVRPQARLTSPPTEVWYTPLHSTQRMLGLGLETYGLGLGFATLAFARLVWPCKATTTWK